MGNLVARDELRDERVAVVESKQTVTLAKILTAVEKDQSIWAMFIAGDSGIGGRIVAGAAHLLNWLSH